MSNKFEIKAVVPNLFAVAVAEFDPHEEHEIDMYGRVTPINPQTVRHHNVSALIEGSADITWPGHGTYHADGSMWLDHTAAGQDELNTCHRCPICSEGMLTTPSSPTFNFKMGPSGGTYVCFSVLDDLTMLDYDVSVGPARYRFQDDDPTGDRIGYVVAARGHACMSGVGDCELWQPYECPPRDVVYIEGDDDAIVFYLWEKA